MEAYPRSNDLSDLESLLTKLKYIDCLIQHKSSGFLNRMLSIQYFSGRPFCLISISKIGSWQIDPLAESWKQQKHLVLPYPLMENLLDDREDHPNQQENNQKLCDENKHSLLSLQESQWKLC